MCNSHIKTSIKPAILKLQTIYNDEKNSKEKANKFILCQVSSVSWRLHTDVENMTTSFFMTHKVLYYACAVVISARVINYPLYTKNGIQKNKSEHIRDGMKVTKIVSNISLQLHKHYNI